MTKKLVAIILLIVLFFLLVGLVFFFIRSTQKDIISDYSSEQKSIPILFSFEYKEKHAQGVMDRIISLVILLDNQTKRIGILELPAYTGVYDNTLQVVAPMDYTYSNANYQSYKEKIQSTLNISNLPHIFVKENNLEHFIDILGGVEIFIIEGKRPPRNREEVTDNRFNMDISFGSIYFDGVDMKEYLYYIENSTSHELLKSTQRKEFIISILNQIQTEAPAYKVSKPILQSVNKYVDTSLTLQEFQKILVLFSEFDLESSYFQRLNGRIENIDMSNIVSSKKTDELLSKSKILFTSREVGGLSDVYSSLEEKLTQEYSDKIHQQITITILNGTIINGLASRTRDIYTNAGFNVLSIGNTSRSDIETTTIIDRSGNVIDANFAAQIIGVKSIITDITSIDQAGANLTLILGKDFDGEKVQ